MIIKLKEWARRLAVFLAEEENPKIKEMRGVVPAEYLKQLDLKKKQQDLKKRNLTIDQTKKDK